MTAAIPAILPAAFHYRALQRLKNRILSYNKQNYSATGILDKESRTDLKWWSSLLQNHNGRTLVTPTASLSDTSTRGWGVYCQGKKAGGPWQTMERKQHINLLELKSAFLALQTFVSNMTNTHVLLRIDNRTAIAYINQKGGTHSKPLSDVACNLWSWCLKRNINSTSGAHRRSGEHPSGLGIPRVSRPLRLDVVETGFFTGFKPSGGRWM